MAPSAGLSRDVTIVNALGLHARSAAKIARIAQAARSRVWLIHGTERADAATILELLALGCGPGAAVTIRVEDPADREVLQALARLVEEGFGEERESPP
jgi:phosphocarrier protein